MLRASALTSDGILIVAGISEGNVERLKAGSPIHVSLRSFGVSIDGSLFIFYGKSEAEMEATLERFNLIGDETQKSTDPRIDQEAAVRRDHEKILIATVGLPRSGKTTWARSQAYPMVNPDSIRLSLHGQRFCASAEPMVWAVAKLMVRSLFLAGHKNVILDATNTTVARRKEWQSSEWGLFFKEINTSKQECLRRAAETKDDEIVPVIERMAAAYEPLIADECRW